MKELVEKYRPKAPAPKTKSESIYPDFSRPIWYALGVIATIVGATALSTLIH